MSCHLLYYTVMPLYGISSSFQSNGMQLAYSRCGRRNVSLPLSTSSSPLAPTKRLWPIAPCDSPKDLHRSANEGTMRGRCEWYFLLLHPYYWTLDCDVCNVCEQPSELSVYWMVV